MIKKPRRGDDTSKTCHKSKTEDLHGKLEHLIARHSRRLKSVRGKYIYFPISYDLQFKQS